MKLPGFWQELAGIGRNWHQFARSFWQELPKPKPQPRSDATAPPREALQQCKASHLPPKQRQIAFRIHRLGRMLFRKGFTTIPTSPLPIHPPPECSPDRPAEPRTNAVANCCLVPSLA